MRALVIAGLLALMSSAAEAKLERRFALVIGNNAGGADAVKLHYAESDADKLAAVIQELGGFQPNDVRILRGATADGVRGAIDGRSAAPARATTCTPSCWSTTRGTLGTATCASVRADCQWPSSDAASPTPKRTSAWA